MKMERRGSSFYRSEMAGLIDQFEEGDLVSAVITGDAVFYDIVRETNHKENKVYVAWGGGSVSQHDPDELLLYGPSISARRMMGSADIVVGGKNRYFGEAVATRRGSSDGDVPPDFVGDPKTHGIEEPRGGGFSIMQNLAEDLREESIEEADENPRVQASLKSRRAMYFMSPGRVYKKTKNECSNGSVICPRCKHAEMEVLPYTRSIKLLNCPECGWKISTDKVLEV